MQIQRGEEEKETVNKSALLEIENLPFLHILQLLKWLTLE